MFATLFTTSTSDRMGLLLDRWPRSTHLATIVEQRRNYSSDHFLDACRVFQTYASFPHDSVSGIMLRLSNIWSACCDIRQNHVANDWRTETSSFILSSCHAHTAACGDGVLSFKAILRARFCAREPNTAS